MNKQKIFYIIIGVVIILLVVFAIFSNKNKNIDTTLAGQYDEFAICLKDSGAVFYGAFWCSHCKATKKSFGDSVDLLPYVECSSPDGTKQLDICKEKEIEGYPTWEFADGSRLTGELSFETLAEKTGCNLPK